METKGPDLHGHGLWPRRPLQQLEGLIRMRKREDVSRSVMNKIHHDKARALYGL